jgi:hypothetical protein
MGDKEGAGLLLPITAAIGLDTEDCTGLKAEVDNEGAKTALFSVMWEAEVVKLEDNTALFSVGWDVVITL